MFLLNLIKNIFGTVNTLKDDVLKGIALVAEDASSSKTLDEAEKIILEAGIEAGVLSVSKGNMSLTKEQLDIISSSIIQEKDKIEHRIASKLDKDIKPSDK